MRNKKIVLISITIISILFIFYQPVEAKFINLLGGTIGGDNLRPGDEVILAKFDILFLQKPHYDDINGDTWGAIKAINPEVEIYLYDLVHALGWVQDNYPTEKLTGLGRYNVNRGHSMGSVNRDNPGFFLLDRNNQRVQWTWPSNTRYWLDFGNSNFQRYAVEALVTDFVGQPWMADGVYMDYIYPAESSTKTTPVKYDTHAKWSTAMNSFINVLTVELAAHGQKFAGSRGMTVQSYGVDGWLALDSSANPPDIVEEEGAFTTSWGSAGISFWPELNWKRQIDVLSAIKNSKVYFKSGTNLAPGESGIDNYGKSVNFWDGLWFALGSYLVGKNDINNNSYFRHRYGGTTTIDDYYDEYDKIDLGNAISSYNISNINGNNIYWREFEKGYVYVNPTLEDVTSISLPELCKQRTHDNLRQDLRTLKNIDTINLKSHRAAILFKSVKLASLNPPNNFRIIVK